MRIAVVAAHGRSGRAFVYEALAAGHEVRAGIRGNSPFEPHPKLKVVQCNATSRTEVTSLVNKCDAVVTLIGHVKGSNDFVQTRATETIITAMDVACIKRLISLTGTGVWVPGDKNKLLLKILNDVSARFGVKRFDDGIKHIEVLSSSDLRWTVLRVLLLTNGEPGEYRLTPHGPPKAPTPRREVARAILECLENDLFIHEFPVITKVK